MRHTDQCREKYRRYNEIEGHSPPNEEVGQQRIGRCNENGRECGNGTQTRGLVQRRENQLAAPLDREERLTVRGMREEIFPKYSTVLEHDLADCDMSGQVAISIEKYERRCGHLQTGQAGKYEVGYRGNQERAAGALISAR